MSGNGDPSSLRVRAPPARRDVDDGAPTPRDPRGAALSPSQAWADAGHAALGVHTGGQLRAVGEVDASPRYSAFIHTHGMPSPSLGPPAVIERAMTSRTPRMPRPTSRLEESTMSALALPPTATAARASLQNAIGMDSHEAAMDDALSIARCDRDDGVAAAVPVAAGLQHRPPQATFCAMMRKHAVVYSLILACLIGYGGSLFVNGISSALLQSGDASTSDATSKVHAWSSSLLLNSSGRALTLLVVVLPIAWRLRLTTTSAPVSLTADTTYPVLITLFGNIGFLAFFGLVDGGGSDVSTLSAMVGLYSVIPVTWAILRRGERATYIKLGGIALSLAAAVLLGMSPSSGDTAASNNDVTRIITKAALYLLCTGLWGFNDILSSGMRLDVFTLALSSAAGQVLNAAIFGFIALFTAAPCSASGASRDRLAWPHVLIMCANGAAIASWLAFVFLARLAPASVYMPIVSLYTSVSVVLSLGILHESITTWKACGLVLAAVAVVATGWSGANEAPPTEEQLRAAPDGGTGRRLCTRLMTPIAHACELVSRVTRQRPAGGGSGVR